MQFDDIIEKRHSARSFKNKKVDWKRILDAIEVAQKSPFAGNLNNMKFIIIEESDSIAKIAEWCQQTWINEAPALIVAVADDTHLENMYGERGKRYARQQAGAAIEHILLKLTDLEINSCWVGAYSDELVKQHLSIPAHWNIEAIIPVGYEQPQPRAAGKKRKRALVDSIYWEVWERSRRPTATPEPPHRKNPWQ